MIIESLKKDKLHLTRITFDNGEECLIDNEICVNNSLKAGYNLDQDRLDSLKYDSDYSRARSRALWYLDRGDYTEKALFQKLLKGGLSKQPCAAVIARFVELGLVDDRRFAENFAARCNEANISRREAVHKMVSKGVSYDLANEMLDSMDTDEEAQVMAVLKKKYERKLSSENGTEKVYAALIRKGFSFSAVRNVLKKYSEELEFSEYSE